MLNNCLQWFQVRKLTLNHYRQLFNIYITNGIDSTDKTEKTILLTIASVFHKLFGTENDDDDTQYGK